MTKSIRYYFFTSILAVLIVCVLVMGLLQVYLSVEYFRNERDATLAQVVNRVNAAARNGQILLEDPDQRSVTMVAGITGVDVFLADTEGEVVFATVKIKNLLGEMIAPNIISQMQKTEYYKEVGRLNGAFEANHYIVAAQITDAFGENAGYVVAASSAAALRTYLTRMGSGFLLSTLIVLALAVALALALAARTIKPIQNVGEAARQFGRGNFAARVPVESDDELAQLAITFNEMANSFEALDSSRRSFMGNIAHELRTPMTSIKGFIDGMIDGTIPKEQNEKYLGIVSDEVGRLARLTQNMLDISKLEAGEHEPKKTRFDVRETVANVFIAAEKRLEKGGIKVEGFVLSKPAVIMADKDFVHQVVFNLLDNAIKFTPKDGTITASVVQGRASTIISIRNTGVGIPKDMLPQIFDRFFKVDKSRGINAGGSGLGLHICKVLIGMMEGRIWAESEENVYTEFAFMLPNGATKKAFEK